MAAVADADAAVPVLAWDAAAGFGDAAAAEIAVANASAAADLVGAVSPIF